MGFLLVSLLAKKEEIKSQDKNMNFIWDSREIATIKMLQTIEDTINAGVSIQRASGHSRKSMRPIIRIPLSS